MATGRVDRKGWHGEPVKMDTELHHLNPPTTESVAEDFKAFTKHAFPMSRAAPTQPCASDNPAPVAPLSLLGDAIVPHVHLTGQPYHAKDQLRFGIPNCQVKIEYLATGKKEDEDAIRAAVENNMRLFGATYRHLSIKKGHAVITIDRNDDKSLRVLTQLVHGNLLMTGVPISMRGNVTNKGHPHVTTPQVPAPGDKTTRLILAKVPSIISWHAMKDNLVECATHLYRNEGVTLRLISFQFVHHTAYPPTTNKSERSSTWLLEVASPEYIPTLLTNPTFAWEGPRGQHRVMTFTPLQHDDARSNKAARPLYLKGAIVTSDHEMNAVVQFVHDNLLLAGDGTRVGDIVRNEGKLFVQGTTRPVTEGGCAIITVSNKQAADLLIHTQRNVTIDGIAMGTVHFSYEAREQTHRQVLAGMRQSSSAAPVQQSMSSHQISALEAKMDQLIAMQHDGSAILQEVSQQQKESRRAAEEHHSDAMDLQRTNNTLAVSVAGAVGQLLQGQQAQADQLQTISDQQRDLGQQMGKINAGQQDVKKQLTDMRDALDALESIRQHQGQKREAERTTPGRARQRPNNLLGALENAADVSRTADQRDAMAE